MSHHFPIRVYYEDTDMGGIVYHANYLKFIERARSDWVRGLGIDQVAMKEEGGVAFAVRKIEAEYLQAAKFDEELDVITKVENVSGARLVLEQVIERAGEMIFSATVTIVCISDAGQPVRLPGDIRLRLH